MELILKRDYNPAGVNGTLSFSSKMICRSIELPWKDNLRGQSCIPEGRYELIPRSSQKYGECIELLEVPNRSGILIHPANYALTELRGCIAPVLKATAPGKGIFSRMALERIMNLCRPNFESNKNVYLIIAS